MIDNRKRITPILPGTRSRTNIQIRSDKLKFSLSKDEEKIYGERFPSGYKKLKILGRGGCALVWLAEDSLTGQRMAIKQVSRLSGSNAIDSCKREIHFNISSQRDPSPLPFQYRASAGFQI